MTKLEMWAALLAERQAAKENRKEIRRLQAARKLRDREARRAGTEYNRQQRRDAVARRKANEALDPFFT